MIAVKVSIRLGLLFRIFLQTIATEIDILVILFSPINGVPIALNTDSLEVFWILQRSENFTAHNKWLQIDYTFIPIVPYNCENAMCEYVNGNDVKNIVHLSIPCCHIPLFANSISSENLSTFPLDCWGDNIHWRVLCVSDFKINRH